MNDVPRLDQIAIARGLRILPSRFVGKARLGRLLRRLQSYPGERLTIPDLIEQVKNSVTRKEFLRASGFCAVMCPLLSSVNALCAA